MYFSMWISEKLQRTLPEWWSSEQGQSCFFNLQYDGTAEHWLLLTSSYFNYITSVVGIALGEVFMLAILG